MYYDELIFTSKNKTKTMWKMIKKKEIQNNNCQDDIKSLKINNNITSNSQEFPNSFNIRPLSVAVTVIGNIKKITVILGIT